MSSSSGAPPPTAQAAVSPAPPPPASSSAGARSDTSVPTAAAATVGDIFANTAFGSLWKGREPAPAAVPSQQSAAEKGAPSSGTTTTTSVGVRRRVPTTTSTSTSSAAAPASKSASTINGGSDALLPALHGAFAPLLGSSGMAGVVATNTANTNSHNTVNNSSHRNNNNNFNNLSTDGHATSQVNGAGSLRSVGGGGGDVSSLHVSPSQSYRQRTAGIQGGGSFGLGNSGFASLHAPTATGGHSTPPTLRPHGGAPSGPPGYGEGSGVLTPGGGFSTTQRHHSRASVAAASSPFSTSNALNESMAVAASSSLNGSLNPQSASVRFGAGGAGLSGGTPGGGGGGGALYSSMHVHQDAGSFRQQHSSSFRNPQQQQQQPSSGGIAHRSSYVPGEGSFLGSQSPFLSRGDPSDSDDTSTTSASGDEDRAEKYATLPGDKKDATAAAADDDDLEAATTKALKMAKRELRQQRRELRERSLVEPSSSGLATPAGADRVGGGAAADGSTGLFTPSSLLDANPFGVSEAAVGRRYSQSFNSGAVTSSGGGGIQRSPPPPSHDGSLNTSQQQQSPNQVKDCTGDGATAPQVALSSGGNDASTAGGGGDPFGGLAGPLRPTVRQARDYEGHEHEADAHRAVKGLMSSSSSSSSSDDGNTENKKNKLSSFKNITHGRVGGRQATEPPQTQRAEVSVSSASVISGSGKQDSSHTNSSTFGPAATTTTTGLGIKRKVPSPVSAGSSATTTTMIGKPAPVGQRAALPPTMADSDGVESVSTVSTAESDDETSGTGGKPKGHRAAATAVHNRQTVQRGVSTNANTNPSTTANARPGRAQRGESPPPNKEDTTATTATTAAATAAARPSAQQQQQKHQQQHSEPTCNLFVCYLPPRTGDGELLDLAQRALAQVRDERIQAGELDPNGPCKTHHAISAKVARHPDTNETKGFGFVLFDCTEAAVLARSGLDGLSLAEGKRLVVRFASPIAEDGSDGNANGGSSAGAGTGGGAVAENRNIYVKGLPPQWMSPELRTFFETRYGPVENAIVLLHRGESKCLGLVLFSDLASARKAVADHGKALIEGWTMPLQIRYSVPDTAKKRHDTRAGHQITNTSNHHPQHLSQSQQTGHNAPNGRGGRRGHHDGAAAPAPPPAAAGSGNVGSTATGRFTHSQQQYNSQPQPQLQQQVQALGPQQGGPQQRGPPQRQSSKGVTHNPYSQTPASTGGGFGRGGGGGGTGPAGGNGIGASGADQPSYYYGYATAPETPGACSAFGPLTIGGQSQQQQQQQYQQQQQQQRSDRHRYVPPHQRGGTGSDASQQLLAGQQQQQQIQQGHPTSSQHFTNDPYGQQPSTISPQHHQHHDPYRGAATTGPSSAISDAAAALGLRTQASPFTPSTGATTGGGSGGAGGGGFQPMSLSLPQQAATSAGGRTVGMTTGGSGGPSSPVFFGPGAGGQPLMHLGQSGPLGGSNGSVDFNVSANTLLATSGGSGTGAGGAGASGHSCQYCRDGSSVILYNMPYDAVQCEANISRLLGGFGVIVRTECLSNGMAVATFAEHANALIAVQCLANSMFHLAMLDCTRYE